MNELFLEIQNYLDVSWNSHHSSDFVCEYLHSSSWTGGSVITPSDSNTTLSFPHFSILSLISNTTLTSGRSSSQPTSCECLMTGSSIFTSLIVSDLMYGLVRAPGAVIDSFRWHQPMEQGTSNPIVIFSKNGLRNVFDHALATRQIQLTTQPRTLPRQDSQDRTPWRWKYTMHSSGRSLRSVCR